MEEWERQIRNYDRDIKRRMARIREHEQPGLLSLERLEGIGEDGKLNLTDQELEVLEARDEKYESERDLEQLKIKRRALEKKRRTKDANKRLSSSGV